MIRTRLIAPVLAALLVTGGDSYSQSTLGTQLAELMRLKEKVDNEDTRVRVEAFHRVWTIGLAAANSEVKLTALELLKEPVGSASDHIRMPAVYAIAEVANSTQDVQVKTNALAALREPLNAGQVAIRDVAIDAVNSIVRSARPGELAEAAVTALAGPVRSGNNGVRIPAIHALIRAVEGSHNDGAYTAALDLLVEPLSSSSLIGGMEVRLMAVVAVERIGIEASEIRTKAKAMALLQSYAGKGSWEPEARKRANEAALNVQNSMKEK